MRQADLRLLRSSCSNAAVMEGFSVLICNRNDDTYIMPCRASTYDLHSLKPIEGTFIKTHGERVTYILIRMSHNGNIIPTKVQGGDKQNY
jgi:hypothetical protein